jgi:hypothetical protein
MIRFFLSKKKGRTESKHEIKDRERERARNVSSTFIFPALLELRHILTKPTKLLVIGSDWASIENPFTRIVHLLSFKKARAFNKPHVFSQILFLASKTGSSSSQFVVWFVHFEPREIVLNSNDS